MYDQYQDTVYCKYNFQTHKRCSLTVNQNGTFILRGSITAAARARCREHLMPLADDSF
uniref:Uncharacterized protein n=1 Tax=Anguilla anguilla TaxID=7936 RepID=A0A0E9S109_ANGAN